MFSLMQPDRRPVDEPRSRGPVPAPPAAPIGSSKPSEAEAPADWPKDVHLPDEKEDDEC